MQAKPYSFSHQSQAYVKFNAQWLSLITVDEEIRTRKPPDLTTPKTTPSAPQATPRIRVRFSIYEPGLNSRESELICKQGIVNKILA